ncbi:MAG: hypothetical protein QW511_03605 [Candidatus Methanomethylicia archaeon]
MDLELISIFLAIIFQIISIYKLYSKLSYELGEIKGRLEYLEYIVKTKIGNGGNNES